MNISFSEIIVILLIALLVIKPEQLPEVAYAIGRLFNFVSNFFKKIKKEFNVVVDSATGFDESKRTK